MLVIAENLNIRNAVYIGAVHKKNWKAIEGMAEELAGRGSDVINVQVSSDGTGDEDTLPCVTEAVQHASGLPLCLEILGTRVRSERPFQFAKNLPSSTTFLGMKKSN